MVCFYYFCYLIHGYYVMDGVYFVCDIFCYDEIVVIILYILDPEASIIDPEGYGCESFGGIKRNILREQVVQKWSDLSEL